MSRAFRRHCVRLLRIPALALLLLAVLANPVLAAMGDLHEIGEGAGAHLLTTGEHEEAAADGRHDGGEERSLLHALMHASHCCGHLTAIVPQAVVLLLPLPPQAVPAVTDTVPPAQRLEPHFRPPIAA